MGSVNESGIMPLQQDPPPRASVVDGVRGGDAHKPACGLDVRKRGKPGAARSFERMRDEV